MYIFILNTKLLEDIIKMQSQKKILKNILLEILF